MVFGVFDLLHPGHVDFLKQAKSLGDFLIVSVARDVNVIRVKDLRPVHDEKRRMANLTAVPYVDRIVLGGLRDPWPHIVKEEPSVIALGYDQGTYVGARPARPNGHSGGGEGRGMRELKKFEEELQSRGLKKIRVVRMKPFWPEVYKSKLIRNKYHEI